MKRTLLIATALAFLAAPALAQNPQGAGGPLGEQARKAGAKPPKAVATKKVRRTRSGQAAGGPSGDAVSTTGGKPAMGAVPGAKASPQSSGGVKR
jgi:hypothetical protein